MNEMPIVLHEQNDSYVYAIDRNRLVIRVRANRQVEGRIIIHYHNKNKKELGFKQQVLEPYAQDYFWIYYQTILSTKQATRYLAYYFEVKTAIHFYVCYNGVSIEVPPTGLFEYLYTNQEQVYHQPDWALGGIIYQVFPDRFARSVNQSDDKLKTRQKNRTDQNGQELTDYWGGDFSGIWQRLDYIIRLGVDVVYFNPVFLAQSYHRYDTVDYYQLCPRLGTRQEFIHIIQRLKEHHISVIIDGVFNHTGREFEMFQKVYQYGMESRYKDWFYIDEFPVDPERLNYETIGYYKEMPKLNYSNSEVMDYMVEVCAYWTKNLSIDGWRIDVADEIEPSFFTLLRRRLRSINPEILLIGEAWQENTGLLSYDKLDGLINYPLYRLIVGYFGQDKISKQDFIARLGHLLGVYRHTELQTMVTMIGCHDTSRFLTVCGNDLVAFQCAVAFQLTFIGMPLIYYGDEVGMTGADDPDCRRPMIFESDLVNKEVSDFYRKMIQLRKKYTCLTKGEIRLVVANSDTAVAYIRRYQEEEAKIEIDKQQRLLKITINQQEQIQHRLGGIGESIVIRSFSQPYKNVR